MPRRINYADHSRGPHAREEEEEDYYEVFLSFCGMDVREGLAKRLYEGLVERDVSVFKDNIELQVGEEFGPEILSAITRSGILIPILSENYGSRVWCLRELTQMMECNKKNKNYVVFPVFYGVKPADVNYQKGIFGEKFRSHKTRFNEQVVDDWRQALKKVASIVGYKSGRHVEQEKELVKKLVDKVCHELDQAAHYTWAMNAQATERLKNDHHRELKHLDDAIRDADRKGHAERKGKLVKEKRKLIYDFHDSLKRMPVERRLRSDRKMVRNKIHLTLHEYRLL